MEKGLSYFIQRAVILHQYRHLLRASSALRRRDVTMAADVRQRVHAAFRDEVADPLLVKKMISDGAKQLTLLESLAGIESSSAAGSKGKEVDPMTNSYIGAEDQKGMEGKPVVWPWQE